MARKATMNKSFGPKPGSPKGSSKGRQANPKLKGGQAGQVGGTGSSGMFVGGKTDTQANRAVAGQGKRLSKQLKKNKSVGLKKF
jgi:hypothetical protein